MNWKAETITHILGSDSARAQEASKTTDFRLAARQHISQSGAA